MKSIKLFFMAIIALAAVMLFFGCTVTPVLPETGECGEDSSWILEDGVLTIEGTGAVETPVMPVGEAKKIVVSEGITELGDEALKNVLGAVEIRLPETLEKIGKEAFSGMKGVEEIQIPDSVKDIAGDAFRGWEETQTIISDWYEGSAEEWQKYYDLWKEYGEKFKAFIEDSELRVKLQEFANKWGAYIEEHFDEIVASFEGIEGEVEGEITDIIGKFSEYEDGFINDVMALIPYIDEVLGKMETEGKGIVNEIQGEIGSKMKEFHYKIYDMKDVFGGSLQEAYDLLAGIVPEYAEGLKAALGIGDKPSEEPSEESGDSENTWFSFWKGIDPEVLDSILDAVEKKVGN